MDTEKQKLAPGTVIHKFELAGLGKAPFVMVGFETKTFQAAPGAPIQPGGCCHYCFTGIMLCFTIQSADGKRFIVGSDCVHKTDDKGLKKIIDEKVREHNRKLRQARADRVLANVGAALADPATRELLGAQPHPRGFTDRDTGRALTLLDWAEWMMKHAGAKGRAEIAKKINALSKEEC